MKSYAATHDKSAHTDEENRYVEKTLEFYDRNGMSLPEDKKQVSL